MHVCVVHHAVRGSSGAGGGAVEEEGEERVKKSKTAREAPENCECLPEAVALVDLPPLHTAK